MPAIRQAPPPTSADLEAQSDSSFSFQEMIGDGCQDPFQQDVCFPLEGLIIPTLSGPDVRKRHCLSTTIRELLCINSRPEG